MRDTASVTKDAVVCSSGEPPHPCISASHGDFPGTHVNLSYKRHITVIYVYFSVIINTLRYCLYKCNNLSQMVPIYLKRETLNIYRDAYRQPSCSPNWGKERGINTESFHSLVNQGFTLLFTQRSAIKKLPVSILEDLRLGKLRERVHGQSIPAQYRNGAPPEPPQPARPERSPR